jgi:hypothetical protein
MGLFYMARTFRRKTGRKTRSNKKSTRRSRRKIIRGGMKFPTLTTLLTFISATRAFISIPNRAVIKLDNGSTVVGTIYGYDATNVAGSKVYIPKDIALSNFPKNAVYNGGNGKYYVKESDFCDSGVQQVTLHVNKEVRKQQPTLNEEYTYETTCSDK